MGFISLVEDGVLLVQVAEIPVEGVSIKDTAASWFPVQEVSRCGDLLAEVFIRRNDDRIFVTGSIDLVFLLPCDRCLEDFELAESITFRVVFDLNGENPALKTREYECSDEEMDVVFLKENCFDLGAILAQQVVLAVPRKNLCRQDCLGLCPCCGEDMNQGKCSCRVEGGYSPFDVLGHLVTKKK